MKSYFKTYTQLQLGNNDEERILQDEFHVVFILGVCVLMLQMMIFFCGEHISIHSSPIMEDESHVDKIGGIKLPFLLLRSL